MGEFLIQEKVRVTGSKKMNLQGLGLKVGDIGTIIEIDWADNSASIYFPQIKKNWWLYFVDIEPVNPYPRVRFFIKAEEQ